jgi:hypothetical protein
MQPINVTASDVVAELRAVVAEQPDYVYEYPGEAPDKSLDCYYVHPSESGTVPGCVVGHVLNRLGVPLHVLRGYEGSDARNVAERTLNITGDPDHGHDARLALQQVQCAQDRGMAWGAALAMVLDD